MFYSLIFTIKYFSISLLEEKCKTDNRAKGVPVIPEVIFNRVTTAPRIRHDYSS
jgi:hypothetical protein